MKASILAKDLDYILQQTNSVWADLQNGRLFITGGTGFIGTWLLECLAWANQKLKLNLSVVILTRNIGAFTRKAPHLVKNKMFTFILGDVRDFLYPSGKFTHIIHAATDADAKLNRADPQLMLDTILQGTRHTLDFASFSEAHKYLYLSSGAVYGRQPPHLNYLTEDFISTMSGCNSAELAYGVAKSAAEHMCVLHTRERSIEIKIARCFALVGPYLPLDKNFAIGNFIRDGLKGETIHVHGDGSPYRSYLYAADLIIWLLHILVRGESCVPYNVGSADAISIAELAQIVAACFQPMPSVVIAKTAEADVIPERYIPSVDRAENLLGLQAKISLQESIRKTIDWHRHNTDFK